MQLQIITLTESEINEQVKYTAKYKALIEKELSYGDLMDLDNINSYAASMKHHATLAERGCIELPINA